MRLTSIVHTLSPVTDNCPSWISRRVIKGNKRRGTSPWEGLTSPILQKVINPHLPLLMRFTISPSCHLFTWNVKAYYCLLKFDGHLVTFFLFSHKSGIRVKSVNMSWKYYSFPSSLCLLPKVTPGNRLTPLNGSGFILYRSMPSFQIHVYIYI